MQVTQIIWWILLITLIGLFVTEMSHSLKRSNLTAKLVLEYENDLSNPNLGEAIYNFCIKDYKLKRIMRKHQATRVDLDKLREKLVVWGNFRKGRRLVPINSFFYAYTLDYLLTHKDDNPKELVVKMMNFFHI